MPLVSRKVWNNRRKLLGNLLPALFFLPPAALGVKWMLDNDAIFGRGLWLMGLAVVLGWVGLNLFGLHANAFMRRELRRELEAKGHDFQDPHIFVGFASPRFFNILDAHEDIGFLFLRKGFLEFVGEANDLKVPREEIRRIRFRPNIHTWVGLGRWICIEGTQKNVNFRMSIEPREKNFLMLNLLDSKRVLGVIRAWRGK